MYKRKVVIVGGGFAGFQSAKELSKKYYDVTIVSDVNHFLFTPLLPSTTVGTVEYRSIIEPLASSRHDFYFVEAQVTQLDPESKKIFCQSPIDQSLFDIDYDDVILAVGGSQQTFGIQGVKEHTYFLRTVRQARALRTRVLECLSIASLPHLTDEQRKRWLHFIIVGGGPTGVEFAAELRDFLNAYLPSVSPGIHSLARISLLEASPEILSVFDASLSHYALGKLNDQGVDVYRNAIVKKVDQGEVVLQDGAPFLGQTIVWSTGIKPTDLIQNLKVPKTKSGRVLVDAFFRIPSLPDIYALGDCADVEDKNFPATAQVAMQEAKSLARQFNDRAKQREAKPFSYKHMGMLAYIGDHDALVDLPFVKGKGVFAWLFWRSAYLTKLVSLRHKMMVLWDWCKSFLFGPDVSRF